MVMKFKTREVLTKIDPYVLGNRLSNLQREHGLGSFASYRKMKISTAAPRRSSAG